MTEKQRPDFQTVRIGRNVHVCLGNASAITRNNAEEVKMALFYIIREPRTHLILDMGDVDTIDSDGAAAFNLIAKSCPVLGSTFTLIRIRPALMDMVRQVMQIGLFQARYVSEPGENGYCIAC